MTPKQRPKTNTTVALLDHLLKHVTFDGHAIRVNRVRIYQWSVDYGAL